MEYPGRYYSTKAQVAPQAHDRGPARSSRWATVTTTSLFRWGDDVLAAAAALEPHQTCLATDAACSYDTENERLAESEPERKVVVDRSYIETHTATVRDRLVKAGVRLGGLLNQALGS